MSNVLSAEKLLGVTRGPRGGNSERAVERMTGVNARTIARLAMLAGAGAQRLHARLVRDLSCSLVQVNEIWSYVAKKEARVTAADAPEIGEAYSFGALDVASRLVVAFHLGKCDEASTEAFIADLRASLVVMPQMTRDGFAPYINAIGASLGPCVEYAVTIKSYRAGATRGHDYRYEPLREPFITRR